MQGWTGIVPPHWDATNVDEVWPIEDEEALAMSIRLAQEEGIFAGISTGANVVAATDLDTKSLVRRGVKAPTSWRCHARV